MKTLRQQLLEDASVLEYRRVLFILKYGYPSLGHSLGMLLSLTKRARRFDAGKLGPGCHMHSVNALKNLWSVRLIGLGRKEGKGEKERRMRKERECVRERDKEREREKREKAKKNMKRINATRFVVARCFQFSSLKGFGNSLVQYFATRQCLLHWNLLKHVAMWLLYYKPQLQDLLSNCL